MPVYYGGMKQRYSLITIKFKIAKTESLKEFFDYKDLIRSFRHLQDIGVIKVKYFDNKEIEEVSDSSELYRNKKLNGIF